MDDNYDSDDSDDSDNNNYFEKKWRQVTNPLYVFSTFAVKKGVYFYEIEILENRFNRPILTGWITKLADIPNLAFVYNYSNDKESFIYCKKKVLPGDIIGCLVNLEQKIVNVYFNGQPVFKNGIKKLFVNLPIFAFTIFHYRQTIRVNFGDKKFKYPLSFNEQYKTFHSVTIKKLPSFQIKTKKYNKGSCKCQLGLLIKKKSVVRVFDYCQNNLKIPIRFNDLLQKQLNKKVE